MPLVTKTFSDIITFTRNSGATYFDSNGVLQTAGNNVPRLDYNPSTLAAQGLLIEEQRTNLLTYSQSFRNRTLTVSGTSGTFLDGETVTSTGGGGGIYVLSESTPTSFALYNPTGVTFTGTLTGLTSGATTSITGAVGNWSIGGSQITLPINSQLAPDGTMSAQLLSPTTVGTIVRNISQSYSTSTTGNYTFSVFVKVGTGPANNQVALLIRDQTNSNNVRANFNLSTLNVPTISAGGTWTAGVATVTPCQNGWVRLSISGNASTAFTSLASEIYMGGYQGTAETIGNFYIWGAQLESGAFPTSYIPTTTTALTRSADVASVNTLSPWYNATEGTLFAEWNSFLPNGSQLAYVTDFTDNPTLSTAVQLSIQSRALNNQIRVWQSTTGGGLDDFITLSVVTFQGKTAVAYGGGSNVSASANGGAVSTMVNPLQSSVFTNLLLGYAAGTTGQLDGWLRRVTYYPRRLSNAELVSITT